MPSWWPFGRRTERPGDAAPAARQRPATIGRRFEGAVDPELTSSLANRRLAMRASPVLGERGGLRATAGFLRDARSFKASGGTAQIRRLPATTTTSTVGPAAVQFAQSLPSRMSYTENGPQPGGESALSLQQQSAPAQQSSAGDSDFDRLRRIMAMHQAAGTLDRPRMPVQRASDAPRATGPRPLEVPRSQPLGARRSVIQEARAGEALPPPTAPVSMPLVEPATDPAPSAAPESQGRAVEPGSPSDSVARRTPAPETAPTDGGPQVSPATAPARPTVAPIARRVDPTRSADAPADPGRPQAPPPPAVPRSAPVTRTPAETGLPALELAQAPTPPSPSAAANQSQQPAPPPASVSPPSASTPPGAAASPAEASSPPATTSPSVPSTPQSDASDASPAGAVQRQPAESIAPVPPADELHRSTESSSAPAEPSRPVVQPVTPIGPTARDEPSGDLPLNTGLNTGPVQRSPAESAHVGQPGSPAASPEPARGGPPATPPPTPPAETSSAGQISRSPAPLAGAATTPSGEPADTSVAPRPSAPQTRTGEPPADGPQPPRAEIARRPEPVDQPTVPAPDLPLVEPSPSTVVQEHQADSSGSAPDLPLATPGGLAAPGAPAGEVASAAESSPSSSLARTLETGATSSLSATLPPAMPIAVARIPDLEGEMGHPDLPLVTPSTPGRRETSPDSVDTPTLPAGRLLRHESAPADEPPVLRMAASPPGPSPLALPAATPVQRQAAPAPRVRSQGGVAMAPRPSMTVPGATATASRPSAPARGGSAGGSLISRLFSRPQPATGGPGLVLPDRTESPGLASASFGGAPTTSLADRVLDPAGFVPGDGPRVPAAPGAPVRVFATRPAGRSSPASQLQRTIRPASPEAMPTFSGIPGWSTSQPERGSVAQVLSQATSAHPTATQPPQPPPSPPIGRRVDLPLATAPEVQRSDPGQPAAAGEATGTIESVSESGDEAGGGLDLDKIEEELWSRLRYRLRVERERSHGWI